MRPGFALMTLAALGCGDPVPGPVDKMSGAIRGGAADTEHAAVVALITSLGMNRQGICSGTVIHVQDGAALVLTAAHCVVEVDVAGDAKIPPEPLPAARIVVAPNGLVGGPTLPATAVTVNPGYDAFIGSRNDVAIVRVTGDVATLPVLPSLAPADDQLQVGSILTLVGFGEAEQPESFGARRTVDKPVKWLNDQFLGFDQTDGLGACSGDSGGPALVTIGGSILLAGVASFVSGTRQDECETGFTSIRIGQHSAFLAKAIDDIDAAPAPDGGCALAPAAAPDGFTLDALLVAALLALRRRR